MRVSLAIALAACSASPSPSPAPSPSPSPSPPAPPPPPTSTWLPGDLHVHVTPPDTPSEVDGTLDDIVASARDAHLAFVVLTPHLRDVNHGRARVAAWRDLQARAKRVSNAPTLIVGAEWTTRRGHFGVYGIDVATVIAADDVLAAARAAGAIIIVNHPFAVPTHIRGVAASEFDMSYRVWTDHEAGFTDIDGAEVWNVPLSLANILSQPGGATGEELAWRALDARVHATHRRALAVGGSDDHHGHALATTWVLAPDATEASILAGVRAGATCVGGPEAGTLRIRGDGASTEATIGGAVTGRRVTLTWTGGPAHVFVDGADRGALASPFTDDTADQLHTYRLELGRSHCGFVYANL